MRNFWGENEISFLKQLYEKDGLGLSELYPIFIKEYDRTLESVQLKISKLKLRHTKEQTGKIKHRLNSGNKNGMFGKISAMKGLTKENSEIVKIKSKKTSETRKQMFIDGLLPILTGDTNPMYGSIAWNNGKTKDSDDRILKYGLKISKSNKIGWLNKSEDDKANIIKRLNDAMIQVRKPTKIETKVNDFLKTEKINFEVNHPINNFRVDFYLIDYNLVIECDGDYWHGNPRVYSDKILGIIQLKNIDRDRRKEKMLLENNIDLLRFWEYDIKNNFDTIKTIIWEKLQKK
jgi:very-short-patch-repair endonuclease